MKKGRMIAVGLITGAMLVSAAVSGVEARGRNGNAGGGQGQNLRLRDGSCTKTPGTMQGTTAGQRRAGNSDGVRPLDGTGYGFGDGTHPRPKDGTGFGSGAAGK